MTEQRNTLISVFHADQHHHNSQLHAK